LPILTYPSSICPLVVTPLKFRRDLWHQQTRVLVLSYSVIRVILGSAVLVEIRLVTDRRTDRWTDGRTHDDSTYCAIIASRGKK